MSCDTDSRAERSKDGKIDFQNVLATVYQTLGIHAEILVGDLDHGAAVEVAEEVDRFNVLAAAELVGQPLAVLAGIVEVQHRGDRIDAETVDVVLLAPEPGA